MVADNHLRHLLLMPKGVEEMITRSPLTDQLAPIYQQQLDFESGATSSPGDMSRRELETMLGVGILVFQNIRHRHLAWYAGVEANCSPYAVEDAERFAEEYRQWNEATKQWLAQVERFEHEGREVDHAAEVRFFHEELKLVDLDVRGLMRRWEELEQGKGIEAAEFFASLRKRASA